MEKCDRCKKAGTKNNPTPLAQCGISMLSGMPMMGYWHKKCYKLKLKERLDFEDGMIKKGYRFPNFLEKS